MPGQELPFPGSICRAHGAGAHSCHGKVEMELDKICLFLHEMACLAKIRTHLVPVGDVWAQVTPCIFHLAARTRFVIAWTEGWAEHSAGLHKLSAPRQMRNSLFAGH